MAEVVCASGFIRQKLWVLTSDRALLVGRLFFLVESRVEGDAGRREVRSAHERKCILCPPLTVHARVLPLDRERTRVANPVECAEEPLEVHVAVAWRDKVPATLQVAEIEMTT